MRRTARRLATSFVALAVLVAAFVSAAASPRRDGTWTVAKNIGFARSTPAVGVIGNAMYIFGGVHDDFRTGIDVFYNDLYRFDAPTKRFTQLSPSGLPPAPRAFAAGLADPSARKLYVFGGATYQANFVGFIAHNDLWAYDVAANEWSRLGPPAGGPMGRSRPNMWLVGRKLYVFGGITSAFETLNDLWSFDLRTNEWTQLIAGGAPGSPPTRHEGQAGTIPLNGKLIVYGGERVDLSQENPFVLLPDTWEYDIVSNKWRNVTPKKRNVNPPRNYGAAAVIAGSLYLQGGDIPGGSQGCGAPFPQNPRKDLWRFDAARDAWRKLAPAGRLPSLKRSVAAVVRGDMYVLAGYDFDCEMLTSPGQLWNPYIYRYVPRR
jgi:N-acetylneuraminic acid mutarotase